MPQELNNNIVQLAGQVFSCTTEKDGQGVKARLQICTAKTVVEKDKVRLENPLVHRVIVDATGEKAAKLQEIEAKIKTLESEGGKKLPANSDIVSIEGIIAAEKNGQPYILVECDKISFPKKLSMKNTIALQGKVIGIQSNITYASAIIELDNPANNGTEVKIPVCISNADNPQKYAEISQGKVKKGDILSVKGPLISQIYSNGEKEIYLCSVRIANYENLSQKQTQTKSKKSQIGLN